MGLADDLLAPAPGRGGPQCTIGHLFDTLDTADAEALRTVLALDMHTMPNTVIARRLTDAGHKVQPGVVGRHRRGECACQT